VAVLLDDLIDTAGTITNAAKALRDNGAREVYACSTHAVLSPPAVERLSSGVFHEVSFRLIDGVRCPPGDRHQHHSSERREQISGTDGLVSSQSPRRDYLESPQCFGKLPKSDAILLECKCDKMPSAEENFRVLLSRLGVSPSRSNRSSIPTGCLVSRDTPLDSRQHNRSSAETRL